MAACACGDAVQHTYTTVHDALMGNSADAILATAERLAFAEEKWLGLYRCRVCGTLWVEGCYDRGQVFFYYLFPAQPSDDPVRWLREEATELPAV